MNLFSFSIITLFPLCHDDFTWEVLMSSDSMVHPSSLLLLWTPLVRGVCLLNIARFLVKIILLISSTFPKFHLVLYLSSLFVGMLTWNWLQYTEEIVAFFIAFTEVTPCSLWLELGFQNIDQQHIYKQISLGGHSFCLWLLIQ